MRQQEFPHRRVERKPVHALPGAVDQHGAGAVQQVAGRHEPAGPFAGSLPGRRARP